MLSDVLRELRKKKGITQDELAKMLGIAKSTISMYENGNREPSIEQLKRLAAIFNVDMNYLLQEQFPTILPVEKTSVLVPKLGSVAAGLGCLADNEIIGYEPFDASSLKSGHRYMCLEVKGDSMYPVLIEGDIVLVQCQSSVDSGSFAVLTINGNEGVIKKVKYGPDWIELHSINPMYPVRRFEGAEVTQVNVMGLVVESKRKF